MFYIFCSFTLLVCGEKNILPNLTNCQEQDLVFWPLGAGAARKKMSGAGAAWEKNQEPEPLEKKVRSRSRFKISRFPNPEINKLIKVNGNV